MNFQCVQCGSDAEWYAGFADGEPRGLIAWNANDSTQSWLYNQYMNPIMQQIQQLESKIQMYFYQLKSEAQAVASEIMEAVAALTEQLTTLLDKYAELVVTDPAAAAEVMQEIKVIKQKIAENQQLMVQIKQLVVMIKAFEQRILPFVERLKEIAEDSFYQIIDATTASNQEDLSSDDAIDEYSSEEVWKDFTQTMTQAVYDIHGQVQQFYQQLEFKIQQIAAGIQR